MLCCTSLAAADGNHVVYHQNSPATCALCPVDIPIWLGGAVAAQAAGSDILLLIADDFGVDIARFYPLGPRLQTTPPPPPMPNLEALARRGVLFTRASASPWCSPTRAQILTGR